MTTRAGVSGLLTGCLLIGLLFYPLHVVLPRGLISGQTEGQALGLELLAAVAAAALVAGGGWAAWWGGARARAQRAALGAVAGSLAGLVVFCGLGAAAAGALGTSGWLAAGWHYASFEAMIRVVWWTEDAFWALALIGGALGAVGGLYVRPFPPPAGWDEFDRRQPQMALNVAITAVPSAAVAALLAAGLFSDLYSLLIQAAGDHFLTYSLSPRGVLTWPVVTALLIYLISLAALTLVTPHEARMAEHRPGLDEVKMAAWVGIVVPPALAMGLYRISPALALSPTVMSILLVSGGLCLSQTLTLQGLILPKRKLMPPPANLRQAVFFGSIARSQGPRLVVLCIGCGLAMMAPLYVSVGAPVLSLWLMQMDLEQPAGALNLADSVQRLFGAHAVVSAGLIGGAAVVLVVIYLFYLWLGRRFAAKR